MSKQQRSIKNMFVQPEFKMKLSLYYMALGGLMISVVGALVLQKIQDVQALMNNPEQDYTSQIQITDMMMQCLQISFVGFALFIVTSFIFALVVSHHVAGPQVAINAYIEQLKLGNYKYNRNLRPHDELKSVMSALKELQSVLVEKEEKEKDLK